MSNNMIAVPPRWSVCISVAFSFIALSVGRIYSAEPTPQLNAARFEKMFLHSMPDHHSMAVQMSQICLDKTQRQELRALCQQIITSQQREIGLLQGWLNSWYGLQKTPQMAKDDREMLDRLRAMSVPDFEKQYMIMMIRHHWSAVSHSGQCIERAHDLHRDLEALCESMVEAQVDEIRKMRDWLCNWFGNCNVRSDGDLHPAP